MFNKSDNKLIDDIVTNLEDGSIPEDEVEKKPSDVIIVGGGRVGVHLIEKLNCPRYNITLIDDNSENPSCLRES